MVQILYFSDIETDEDCNQTYNESDYFPTSKAESLENSQSNDESVSKIVISNVKKNSLQTRLFILTICVLNLRSVWQGLVLVFPSFLIPPKKCIPHLYLQLRLNFTKVIFVCTLFLCLTYSLHFYEFLCFSDKTVKSKTRNSTELKVTKKMLITQCKKSHVCLFSSKTFFLVFCFCNPGSLRHVLCSTVSCISSFFC